MSVKTSRGKESARVTSASSLADKMPLLADGVSRAAAKLGVTPVPPATLIGVAALDVPEHLVEIEATAVLD